MKHKSLTIIEWKVLQWLAKTTNDHLNSFTVGETHRLDGSITITVYFHIISDFVQSASKAALAFKERGWIKVDGHGNHTLNAAGLLAAKMPKPSWKPPALLKLTERDLELLNELEYSNHGSSSPRKWVSPMHLGGHNGSHHSATLTRLVRHGYAECRKGFDILTKANIIQEPSLRPQAKGSRHFRITEEGRAFLAKREEIKRASKPNRVTGWFEEYRKCGCVSETVPRKKDLLGYCAIHGTDRANIHPHSGAR